jgi:hypothetical protein
MNSRIIFKSLSFGILLSLSQVASMNAQGKPVILRGEPTVKHYIVHALGDAVGGIAAGAAAGTCLATGMVVGGASGNPEVAGPAMVLSAITGCAAAFYIYYKTPEWTDTYVLERGNGRTMGQNIATLLTRLLLPLWPLGVVAGEYLVYEDDVNGKN